MNIFKAFRCGFLALSIYCLYACSNSPVNVDPDIRHALACLDHALGNDKVYSDRKEARIDSLRLLVCNTESEDQLYRILDLVFNEYKIWNCDSALYYAHRKDLIAVKIGSPALINDAGADIAHRYILSGMYPDAFSIINRTDALTGTFFSEDPSRLFLMYEIYHNLVLSYNDRYAKSEYLEKEADYLNKWSATVSEGSIDYLNSVAKTLIYGGNSGGLVMLFKDKLAHGNHDSHTVAVLNYWLGKAYETMGDRKNSFLRYIASAAADIESANREYRSLIRVAQLCFEDGMTERAYRYITRCHEDALISDAHIRLSQIGDSLSIISTSYTKLSRRQNILITILNASLIILLSILALAIIYLSANQAKLKRANKEISDNIGVIRESNRIKDAYLAQFLSIFSNHIDALERYRSRLRVVAKQMDLGSIQAELRSDDYLNEELSNLHDTFDKTFLGLFPDFIEQLNTLLRPEERIPSDLPAGKLTNELRVLALIRLGVTDSKRIAKFLRLSPTTIFNYRVKYRNAALSRDTFEDILSTLGHGQ